MELIRRLGKDTLLYGFGNIIAKSISFILLPIYTRVFTTHDYGTIELLIVINGFLAIILNTGLDSTQSYYFYKEEKIGEKNQIILISSILQWRLFFGIFIIFLSTIFSPIVNSFFFNSKLNISIFLIAFSTVFFSQIVSQFANIFRLLFKPGKFFIIIISQTFIGSFIALTLIIILDFGLTGYFLGHLGGGIFAALLGFYTARKWIKFKLFLSWWPKLLRFGLPLVPAGISMYVLSASDRWCISYFLDQASLGVYAVGAKFGMLFFILVETFRMAWWPIAMESIHSHEGTNFFKRVSILYFGFGSISVIWLTAFSPILLKVFVTSQYYHAFPIIGPIAWASFLYGFYLILTGGIWKSEKTIFIPILLSISALLNFTLNCILIPQYGIIGAAIATTLSYFFWNVITLIISEYFWRVGYPVKMFTIIILIGILTTSFIIYSYYSNNSIIFPVVAGTIYSVIIIALTRLLIIRNI